MSDKTALNIFPYVMFEVFSQRILSLRLQPYSFHKFIQISIVNLLCFPRLLLISARQSAFYCHSLASNCRVLHKTRCDAPSHRNL